ncbi:OmpA family protein [Sphingomonas prati]|uniref:Outer membrane protein OmpA-like peptidoglycan-associated protein n=1 Tax=Sphingomonas prati TaxID=1843237 RepID=A0A7W9BUW9_9SPHN|nr:OmpA family protein [Sphingomonas prati]MBB5730559.1 outer membrane protein OmpA-like peptidoglycan-associated protein [Sphingomonas prati]GGE94960.1 membrane protein [Sphingomonas prati]
MRKLAITVALATTALATPAMAKDNAWYVGVEGGAMLVEDSKFDIGTVNNGLSVDHEYGFDVDGIVGYDFGPVRIEGEVGYKKAENEALTKSGLANSFGGVPNGRYESKRSGSTDALSFMVNGLLDFGADDGLNGYVGGGAGIARVSANIYRFNGGINAIDDSDTRFAWQAIAGVRYPVTDNVDFGLKYRFFNVDNLRYSGGNGQEAEGRFRSHSLLASLVFNFGEPAAPPPVEPAPAPAPLPPEPVAPAPVAPIPAGPFIVFFDWDKSDITPEAATILDNAAQAFATSGSASVMLAGHADKSGSDRYNVGLSQRRADAVKSYLSGKGIGEGSITTEAFGESRPLVETADGVREPQNRRVEITYGPGSGM